MTTEDGATEAAETAAPDTFADTIWPDVNRTLTAVDVQPERGVLDLIVHIPPADIIRGLNMLKHDEALQFNYLRSLTAVDNEADGVDVVYHLYSVPKNLNLTVKTTLPNDQKVLDTATTVWRAADWLERETAEMFGVTFTNHPDPRPLLMPEDVDMSDTHPLLKSHPFAEIELLQGELLGHNRDAEVED
ncbi:MAG: NADH-quinone oxidoreductase subunit C [Chloroflexi bacterium]|nr:NADH-quinone oxidoreductase subunit C [Chloroflexota bacterium]MDA1146200.1 NADH-quinone oxidoreductase subunit C [Chloroflexota bacterium]